MVYILFLETVLYTVRPKDALFSILCIGLDSILAIQPLLLYLKYHFIYFLMDGDHGPDS